MNAHPTRVGSIQFLLLSWRFEVCEVWALDLCCLCEPVRDDHVPAISWFKWQITVKSHVKMYHDTWNEECSMILKMISWVSLQDENSILPPSLLGPDKDSRHWPFPASTVLLQRRGWNIKLLCETYYKQLWHALSVSFIFDFQQFDLILLSPIVFIELLDIWLNIWNVLSHSLFNYFCSILLLWSPSWMPVTHMMHWNFSRNWILCSPPPPLPSFSLFISHWIFSLELPLFPYPLLCAVCS